MVSKFWNEVLGLSVASRLSITGADTCGSRALGLNDAVFVGEGEGNGVSYLLPNRNKSF